MEDFSPDAPLFSIGYIVPGLERCSLKCFIADSYNDYNKKVILEAIFIILMLPIKSLNFILRLN